MPFKLAERPKIFDKSQPSYILVKSQMTILANTADNRIYFEPHELQLSAKSIASLIYVGELDGKDLYALDQNDLGSETKTYKKVHDIMDIITSEELMPFFRSFQLLNWDLASKFCGACGGIMKMAAEEFVKACSSPTCRHKNFPTQYSVAVNVQVLKGEYYLLGRSPNFRPKMYCPNAGFVEPGETAIQTAHREIFEETRLKIRNVRFFGSDPWPFPNSLMLGFLADYDSGELIPDKKELEDARWFHYTEQPEVMPPKCLLSYRLMQEGRKLCQEHAMKNVGSPVPSFTRALSKPLPTKIELPRRNSANMLWMSKSLIRPPAGSARLWGPLAAVTAVAAASAALYYCSKSKPQTSKL